MVSGMSCSSVLKADSVVALPFYSGSHSFSCFETSELLSFLLVIYSVPFIEVYRQTHQ